MSAETTDQAEQGGDPWAELDAEAREDARREAAGQAPTAAGSAQPPAEQYPKDPQVEQAVQQLLTIGFSAFAPNWNVRQQEIDAAADAYARSIEDIFPGGAAALGPHFASLMMTLAIFGPRVAMRVPPQADEPEQQQETDPEEQAQAEVQNGEG